MLLESVLTPKDDCLGSQLWTFSPCLVGALLWTCDVEHQTKERMKAETTSWFPGIK